MKAPRLHLVGSARFVEVVWLSLRKERKRLKFCSARLMKIFLRVRSGRNFVIVGSIVGVQMRLKVSLIICLARWNKNEEIGARFDAETKLRINSETSSLAACGNKTRLHILLWIFPIQLPSLSMFLYISTNSITLSKSGGVSSTTTTKSFSDNEAPIFGVWN